MQILILEDDVIWQKKLQMMLSYSTDFKLEFVNSIVELSEYLKNNKPDLVLSDILLSDGSSVDFFHMIKREYPVIFLTGYPDEEYLQKILTLPNTSFIVKPFHELTLRGFIDKINLKDTEKQKYICVFGKYKQEIHLLIKEIIYVEADRNYVDIHTQNKVYTLRRALKDIKTELDSCFLQIQKSFIVNISFIDKIDIMNNQIIIHNKHIQIGRKYRKEILMCFKN